MTRGGGRKLNNTDEMSKMKTSKQNKGRKFFPHPPPPPHFLLTTSYCGLELTQWSNLRLPLIDAPTTRDVKFP